MNLELFTVTDLNGDFKEGIWPELLFLSDMESDGELALDLAA